MRQTAPDPLPLVSLVANVRYKSRWRFTLEDVDRGQGSAGLTLCIWITEPDAYEPQKMRSVVHYMPVPPAAFDAASWRRWLFEQVLLVEQHEACEFFRLDDGSGDAFRPYAPNHGPGNDPYTVRELTTDEQRRTSFQGDVKPSDAALRIRWIEEALAAHDEERLRQLELHDPIVEGLMAAGARLSRKRR